MLYYTPGSWHLYGNITVRSFWRIVTDSARMSGMVVFLIGVSNILGWVMAFTQIPQVVSAALLGFTSSPAALLLIMNAVLLLAGTFMDVTPAILIFILRCFSRWWRPLVCIRSSSA